MRELGPPRWDVDFGSKAPTATFSNQNFMKHRTHRGLGVASKFSELPESGTAQKLEILKLLGHSYGFQDDLMIGLKLSLA